MNPALLLFAAACGCLLLAARPRPGTGPATPWWVRLPARVPLPRGLVPLMGGPDRPGDIAAAGLAGLLPPGALPRARCVLALAGACALPAAVAAPALLPVTGLATALGWLLPGVALTRTASARRRRIADQLPDVLELLGVCIGAGMALDPALRIVAGRLDGPLPGEIGAALEEMALGGTRRDAYRAMAARVGLPALDQAVAALVTAEELGTPLSEVLARQAANLRAGAAQDARDRAARAAPKVQLVVATMMVPAVMLLVVTVMAVELGRQLGPVFGGLR